MKTDSPVTPESPSVEQADDVLDAAIQVACANPSVAEAVRYLNTHGTKIEGTVLRGLVLGILEAVSYPLQQAELGRLREDAARLDWLERMAHDGERIGDIDIGGSWERQSVTVGDPVLTGIQGHGATVRAAIDQARAALSGEER